MISPQQNTESPAKVPQYAVECYAARPCRTCGVIFRTKRCNKCILAKRVAKAPENRARHAVYYAANSAHVLSRIAARRAAHPEVEAAYREKNREDRAQRTRDWRIAFPERAALAVKRWRLANPERRRILFQNRRARIKEVGGKLSKNLAQKLYTLQKGKCACCGLPLGRKFHMDHIMPLALGGANEDFNIQLLTGRCNSQKRAKHPADFMRQRGFLI